MADNDQDTPQTQLEGQGEAVPQPAPSIPQEGKEPQTAPAADNFAPKEGETLEQYAARMRSEVNWRDRQMGRQHRKLKEGDEKDAKYREIEAENQRLKELAAAGTKKTEAAPAPASVPKAPAGAPADLKAQARFEVQVERLGAELLEKHADEWRSAHANFERTGGIPPEFLSAVMDTDDPAYVMLKLGKDMTEYQRIMDLPEGRRRAALIKLGMEPGQKAAAPAPVKKPSDAPAPRTELPSGSATPPEGDFSLYDAKYAGSEHDQAWYARRTAEKRNSRGRPWSIGGRGN